MAKSSALQRLSEKLFQIEEEVRTLRSELEDLSRRDSAEESGPQEISLNKVPADLRKRMGEELFAALSIKRRPSIGAKALQEKYREAGLEPNEMSRDLIRAREE
jgi:hypothetical protein